ncbi:MAG: zinc-ribbon domain-containing protein [Anaerolineales bacterium]|nr:zinc-ribbon domain-containing protein [Anaerolineales bacterium]
MYCSQCGNEVLSSEKYCRRCGAENAHGQDGSVEREGGRSSFSAIAIGLSIALGLALACAAGAILLDVLISPEPAGEPDLPYALWYGTDGLDADAELSGEPLQESAPPQTPDEPTPEPLPDPTPTQASSPTPDSPLVALYYGDARSFALPPEMVIYANVDYTPLPAGAGVLWICPSEGFRYYEWVGIPAGCAYEMTLSFPTSSLGVQFWGDGNDGVARVLVDGQIMWEGDTRGEDGNWPGGAFVRYVAIDYLPAGSHVVRVEAAETDAVTIYFIGAGEVLP